MTVAQETTLNTIHAITAAASGRVEDNGPHASFGGLPSYEVRLAGKHLLFVVIDHAGKATAV